MKIDSRIWTLFLAFLYSLFIGYDYLPTGIAATGWFCLFVLFLYLQNKKSKNNKTFISLTITAMVISLFYAITTNPLVYLLNIFTDLFVITMLLLANYNDGMLPQTATEYIKELTKYVFKTASRLFNPKSIKHFAYIEKDVITSKLKINKNMMKGLIIALPVLVFFHVLFSNINIEYADFIRLLFQKVVDAIKYLFEIEFIQILIESVIFAYIIHVLLIKRDDIPTQDIVVAGLTAQEILKTVLILTILLFATFSYFQSKLLFVDLSKLLFKELSLYTQHGFWELLAVSIFGYFLALVILRESGEHHDNNRLKKLLTTFTLELILITIFTLHKLISHEYLFGLKDQRILATAAIGLIFMTFVLFGLRIWKKVSSQTIFSFQYIGLIVVVIVLNAINIDLLITKFNPISYYVNEKKYKDYSYLLGNSTDNYSQWVSLAKEFVETNPPQPTEYYWGNYKPICQRDFYYTTDDPNPDTSTYISDIHNRLAYKYLKFMMRKNLKDVGKFNVREYYAYRTIMNNKELFDNFRQTAKTKCL